MFGPLALVGVCVLIGTSCELLMKTGMGRVGRVGLIEAKRPLATFWRITSNPAILGAGVLYLLGLVLWLAALSQLDLSLALPVLGTTYATVPLMARLILGEPVSLRRWCGVVMIFTGVLLVARS